MKKILLQIPEPCHQNWNTMTESDRGRFCQHCNKTVVDFTLMTDPEILAYFSKTTERTCGHFANDQLNRVIKEPAMPARKSIWAMMLSFMLPVLVYNKTTAQGKVKTDTVQYEPMTTKGRVAPTQCRVQHIIKGHVTDSSGNPLAGAAIMIKGTKTGVAARQDGSFELRYKADSTITLQVSYVGFQVKEIVLNNPSGIINQEIFLEADNVFSGEVVVTVGYAVRKPNKEKKQKIVDTLIQALQTSKISVFPNPVVRDGVVTMKIKGIRSYECYLLDNQGNVLPVAAFTKTKEETQFQVPSSIAPGIYYVTVLDKQSNKKYSEKLIIQ